MNTSFKISRAIWIPALLVLLLFVPGCEDAGERIKNALICLGALIFGIPLLVVVIGLTSQHCLELAEKRKKQREEEWNNANSRYTQAAKTIHQFGPECRYILIEEGKQGRVYESEDCPTSRARSKMLSLIQTAFKYCKLKYDDSITKQRYEIVTSLTSMEDACQNCRQLNQGKGKPQCMLLSGNGDASINLHYKLTTPNGQLYYTDGSDFSRRVS